MKKRIQWLRGEIDAWLAKGLISPEQAGQLRQLYPDAAEGPPWAMIIFAGLGAVIAGLGIILLFAYNWHALPKAVKLALVFLAVIGSHAGGIWCRRCADWRRPLGEALCLLGCMFYGAGIWLVAQIYHIDEHFPNGFLIWAIGTLAVAWALPSAAIGVVGAVLLAIWNCSETLGFEAPVHVAPLLILAGVGGLAFRLRSAALAFFTLVALFLSAAVNVGSLHGSLVVPTLLSLAAVLLALQILMRRHAIFPEAADVFAAGGWTVFLVCLYLLTFAALVDDLLLPRGHRAIEVTVVPLYRWGAPMLAMAGWAVVGAFVLGRMRGGGAGRYCPPESWLVPLTVLLAQVLAVTGGFHAKWWAAAPFNLAFLALTAAWMSRGCREAAFRPTVLAAVMLAALATARYFDLFESLLARGLVFLAVGGVLFADGVLFMRARRRLKDTEARP